MAEIIDRFPEKRCGRPSQYPYNLWLDGRVWKLTRQNDFTCTPRTLVGLVKRYAERRNINVKVTADNGFVFIEAKGDDHGTDEGSLTRG